LLLRRRFSIGCGVSRRLAASRGVSLAAVIREALEEKARRPQPMPRSLGIADSGHTDTSTLAGELRPEPRTWRDEAC
jgi:hypothetical protein